MKLPARDLDEAADGAIASGAGLEDDRVFVTGGTGFIGRWLIESLLHLNARHDRRNRISVLSRDPASFLRAHPHLRNSASLEWVEGSLEHLEAAGAAEKIDLFVHAATASSAELAEGDPALLATMIDGTRRALELAARSRARRFLYLSSGAIYGRQPPDVALLSEDFGGAPDPSVPGSAYAETKRAGESLCAAFARRHGLETVIARGFAFIGPALPLTAKFAAGSFLRDALEGRPIRILGDGTPLRSYLHASEMTAWLWNLLLRGTAGRAYNVGSEISVSIAELARETARLGGRELPVTIGATPRAGAAPERYVPSTARARSELGLGETIGWRESLRRTYEWQIEAFPQARQAAR